MPSPGWVSEADFNRHLKAHHTTLPTTLAELAASGPAFKLLPSPPPAPGHHALNHQVVASVPKPAPPPSVPVPAPVHHSAAPPPPPMPGQIDAFGHEMLCVAFLLMFIPAVLFFISLCRQPKGKRKFHVYTFMINAIATIAYGTMACGYGWTMLDGRQFFYMRYIDWFFTTPLQLADICGLGMVDADTTNLLVGLDMLMIVAGVIGAFLAVDPAIYKKFAFFGFGCLCYLPIVYHLIYEIPRKGSPSGAALAKNLAAKSVYIKVAWLTFITWTCYPIVWYFAEGTRMVSPDTEVIAYMVMDFFAKSVFGFIILCSREGMEEAIEGSPFSETLPLLAAKATAQDLDDEALEDSDLLPPGWIRSAINQDDGRVYYYNTVTKETTFKKPEFPREEDDVPVDEYKEKQMAGICFGACR